MLSANPIAPQLRQVVGASLHAMARCRPSNSLLSRSRALIECAVDLGLESITFVCLQLASPYGHTGGSAVVLVAPGQGQLRLVQLHLA